MGTNVADLDTALAGDHWTVATTEVAQDDTNVGQILLQDPAAGTSLAEGQEIRLVVSTGPPPIPVPTDLVSQSLADATAELTSLGLTVGDVSHAYDENVAKDVVLALGDGVPAELTKGGAVPLVVSDGPKPRTIPSGLADLTQADATAKLTDLGLKVDATPRQPARRWRPARCSTPTPAQAPRCPGARR